MRGNHTARASATWARVQWPRRPSTLCLWSSAAATSDGSTMRPRRRAHATMCSRSRSRTSAYASRSSGPKTSCTGAPCRLPAPAAERGSPGEVIKGVVSAGTVTGMRAVQVVRLDGPAAVEVRDVPEPSRSTAAGAHRRRRGRGQLPGRPAVERPLPVPSPSCRSRWAPRSRARCGRCRTARRSRRATGWWRSAARARSPRSPPPTPTPSSRCPTTSPSRRARACR